MHKLYEQRFVFFNVTLIMILFGPLVIPPVLFESVFAPLFFSVNILAGILLISKKKGPQKIFIVVLISTILTYVISAFYKSEADSFAFVRYSVLFLFYCVVTWEIVTQVWKSEYVNQIAILGLIGGYLCLGLIGFFICNFIEMIMPGSFNGIVERAVDPSQNREGLFYFSFITLMSIGYGDIAPVGKVARNAAVFIGLIGQFYTVILTAIVVGKFINQLNTDHSNS